MSFGLVFWILMLLWLVFGFWASWPTPTLKGSGPNLLLFVLLVLLGWHVFGAPIHS